jgi:hypothetical protein
MHSTKWSQVEIMWAYEFKEAGRNIGAVDTFNYVINIKTYNYGVKRN